jgi:5,10-methenyltetrahydrofolate synthetase
MHEVDPAYMGLEGAADERQKADVVRWRKAERKRLIEARLAMPVAERRARDARIIEHMASVIGPAEGLVVSAYWPFRGEPDLRPLLERLSAGGGRPALPVVVEHGRPLIFRLWSPGEPLGRGVWNIPIPAEGAPEAVPDVVIAPVIGFDRACYRLGFGGGFYDRTLAALSRRPRVLGVGYALAAIPTIYPQWHDIAMDLIVTEDGVYRG